MKPINALNSYHPCTVIEHGRAEPLDPADPKEAKHRKHASLAKFLDPLDLKEAKHALHPNKVEHEWARLIIAITKFKEMLVLRNFRVIESLIQICYNNILLNFMDLFFQAFKSFRYYFIKTCDFYL